ncbi:hypothetical protein ES708_23528 [subsurface metagenome]
MIAASGTGAGRATVQHVPTLPGALTMKNEAGSITARLTIIDDKLIFKTILYSGGHNAVLLL